MHLLPWSVGTGLKLRYDTKIVENITVHPDWVLLNVLSWYTRSQNTLSKVLHAKRMNYYNKHLVELNML